MREELASAERAVTGGVREGADEVKRALRADVIGAGLGARLAKTWRSSDYPRSGYSLGAASEVYTRAPRLIRAFDEGVTIKSSDGFFMAIPTDNAPKSYRRKRVSPSNWPKERYGYLRYVYTKTGQALLVVDNQRASKARGGTGTALSRSKKALATGNGLMTVVMFVLVPQVRLKKRLNVAAISSDAAASMARGIDRNFRLLDAQRRVRS